MPTAQEIARNLPGYFKIEDVRGSELPVTIKSAGLEEVGQDKDVKMVLAFLETPKKLVLNGSRTEQLTKLFPEGEVVGQKVVLVVDTYKVNNRNQEMICLAGVGK